MKIDVGSQDDPKGRETYFMAWSAGRILAGANAPRKGAASRSNIGWLTQIQNSQPDKVILGAAGANSIDDLVSGEYHKDRAAVTQRIANSTDEIIVIPACYRLGGWNAQRAIAYDMGTLVRLDSVAAKRQLLDGSEGDERVFQNGSFSYREMNEWDMTPERMLAAAVKSLKISDVEQTRVGYAWRSPSNQGLHIVSLLRCVEGLELRLMQDYAAWKVLPSILKQQGTKKTESKLRNIERYVKFYDAQELLPRLDLSEADLIEKSCAPRLQRRGWHMSVPSRSSPGEYHKITINNMPIQRKQQGKLHGLKHSWSVNAVDKGETEQEYREGRRVSLGRQSPGKQDFYFTANAIAALHTVRKMHRYQPAGWSCGELPIALARESLQTHADALRYRTVILDTDRVGKPIVRPLGKTEIEDWLWPAVMNGGFDASLTTQPSRMDASEVKEILQFYEGRKKLSV